MTDDRFYTMARVDEAERLLSFWTGKRPAAVGIDVIGSVRGFGALAACNLARAYRPEGL